MVVWGVERVAERGDMPVMPPFHDTGFWCQLLEGPVEGSPGKVFVSPLSWVSESFRRDIWKMFFIIKNIFIMKNLTARKTVEAGVDPHLCSAYLEDNWIKPSSKIQGRRRSFWYKRLLRKKFRRPVYQKSGSSPQFTRKS